MTGGRDSINETETMAANGLRGRRWWLGVLLAFVIPLGILLPTTGDIGLTWDEPAYRFSQLRSAAWWSRLASVRSVTELQPLLEPDALLYYWTYGRHGINFHPPLAGQLNLLTHALFGSWFNDTASRRISSEIEFALTVAIGFGFLARRYGGWVGAVMAGSLFLMPRLFGDAHVAGTDMPGLLIWAAASLAFWKGLNEPNGRIWRIAVGILLGLAFVEKMGAVFVIVPLVGWMAVARLPRSFHKADWIDGVVTTGAMLIPLIIALFEILRLSKVLPKPNVTDLFIEHPQTPIPGAILAVPCLVWVVRRLAGLLFRTSNVWGAERPALETWTSILAFAPLVGWLGNPAWWRETLPRLAHYYSINTDRRNSLPDIQILYLGQIYEYALPWHNGWILIGVTVPLMILIATVFGLLGLFKGLGRDSLAVYFFVQLVTLPIFRMLPTPGHDGVRLFLPTFFFLAGFAGWGTAAVASALGDEFKIERRWIVNAFLTGIVLVPSAYSLICIHPFELSYYNECIGGPRGAWSRGLFELTYWYDAFNPRTLAEINESLPRNASIDFLNPKTNPMTFLDLQSLGAVRKDIRLGARSSSELPYVWLLTQDSKASAFTRLLFAMKPWYALQPPQLDGLRAVTVADPVAVSRAYALQLLMDAADDRPPERPKVPEWVARYVPWLGRFWGAGLTKIPRLGFNRALLKWAKDDPKGLAEAAERVAKRGSVETSPNQTLAETRLLAILNRYPRNAVEVLRARPAALVEAVKILLAHPDEVRRVLTRPSYTDPSTIGGPLDRDLEPS